MNDTAVGDAFPLHAAGSRLTSPSVPPSKSWIVPILDFQVPVTGASRSSMAAVHDSTIGRTATDETATARSPPRTPNRHSPGNANFQFLCFNSPYSKSLGRA